jgi:hypothetical protein
MAGIEDAGMSHTIHDIGVANQIGLYSDAIEAAPNLRWLMTAGTPGFTDASQIPADIIGQSDLGERASCSIEGRYDG